ncbi:hypothetical protein [Streptomyces coeruleorubidus]|uniref:hypothetical protein n=1 Tax=Streptomyces coeruleorubidus TaxID=116188 RepID=UPI0033E61D66
MTNPRNRELDRAVREYKREHPGITLEQARRAVAARAGRQQHVPDRIPGAPLPRPAERLEGYVQRVAAAAGVQRHRAMVLLGLEPGRSATERLDQLTRGRLPERAVRALVAATGMTADQARALPAPLPARPDLQAVRRVTEEALAAGHFRRGGADKTSASVDLAAALSLASAKRANMIDLDLPGAPDDASLDAHELVRLLAEASSRRPLLFDLPGNGLYPAFQRPPITDLDWPADAAWPPADPEAVDEILTSLGTGPGSDTATPAHE